MKKYNKTFLIINLKTLDDNLIVQLNKLLNWFLTLIYF